MKVLLTGAAGQLGQALIASQPRCVAGGSLELIATSRAGLDLADARACRAAVLEHRPDWVLNAGAYTAVDRAEAEPELAMAVNGGAPRALAEGLRELGRGQLLQLSTDFVFDGHQGHPYAPDQPRRPLGVYGASKAAGEEAVQVLLGGGAETGCAGRGFILRTSWVYGPVGHNFCRTLLRLHRQRAQGGEPLRVVADQVGCPTSTAGLAAACWRAIGVGLAPPADAALPPILHWSDAGAASWYDFAVAIGELGVETGLLEQAALVCPITTADYPTPARRPSYSLLDCTASRQALALQPQHWRQALEQVLLQLVAG
ncbi:MAG: dTDP-4-dehydrorhamnose reductase [Cyanobacteriota bacterium]|nr:dTDP-4-dehydrorhamnose reductase [Cyanobacteriota bacterium]